MMVSNAAHSESAVRSATSQALAAALKVHSSFMEKTLDSLLELYAEKNIVSACVASELWHSVLHI